MPGISENSGHYQPVKKRNDKEFNIEKFLMDIEKSEINTIFAGARTTDAAAEAFENIFKSILNENIPLEKELQSLCI